MGLNLPTDLIAAQAFLDALAPHEEFSFQTLPEGEHSQRIASPQILHGKFDDVSSQLSKLNNMGHGIFVMVNQGDLKGRSARNVTKVRSHFIDLDGAPLQAVLDAELPPHIIVESSPDRWHAYWRVDDCPFDQFKMRQQALAARFNGDKAVCDLSRIMRIPGFWHLKTGKPFQSRLVKHDAQGQ